MSSEKNIFRRNVLFYSENLRWNEILKNFVEIKKYNDKWNRINRSYISFYPETLLPSIEEQEKEEVMVFIDSSGSIDAKALSLFIALLRGLPSHIIVHSASFDTECYKYNIHSNDSPIGGGGTKYDILERYVKENFKKYPKLIIVLTDGDGNFINPQFPDKWLWLLYGNCSKIFCGNMKNYKISDLVL